MRLKVKAAHIVQSHGIAYRSTVAVVPTLLKVRAKASFGCTNIPQLQRLSIVGKRLMMSMIQGATYKQYNSRDRKPIIDVDYLGNTWYCRRRRRSF